MAAPLLERLAAHRTLGAVPREQLEWLAATGVQRTLEPGEILTPSTGPVKGLFVVLDGHLLIRVDRGAGPRIVMEWHGGDVTGMLPYSRIKAPPGQRGRRGADRHPGRQRRAPAADDSRVPRADRGDGARDAGPRPRLQVERAARREGGVARPAGRRPGPRAEQPRVGRGAQRQDAGVPARRARRRDAAVLRAQPVGRRRRRRLPACASSACRRQRGARRRWSWRIGRTPSTTG